MSNLLHPGISDNDHLRGDSAADLAITVFGDYECPVSKRLWIVLRSMRADGTKFREAFRHYPLTGVHPHAFLAAQAAEAAADQLNFWPMHDHLFAHQDALEPSDLGAYAGELGLDVERFDEDVSYESFAETVRRHQRSGVSSGVRTTPTIFLNGRPLRLDEPEHLPDALVRLDA
jgi:protein-disulfide isomerase